jgi:tetratricopeptide (TPR) repeat protein
MRCYRLAFERGNKKAGMELANLHYNIYKSTEIQEAIRIIKTLINMICKESFDIPNASKINIYDPKLDFACGANPELVNCYTQLGRCYKRLEKTDDMLKYFKHSVKYGCKTSAVELSYYYKSVNDEVLALRYFDIIKNDHVYIYNLASMYKDKFQQDIYEQLLKLAVDKGGYRPCLDLMNLYIDKNQPLEHDRYLHIYIQKTHNVTRTRL